MMNSMGSDEQAVRESLAKLGNMAPRFQGLQEATARPGRPLMHAFVAASVVALALGASWIAGALPGDDDADPPAVAESGEPSPVVPTSSDQGPLPSADQVRAVADRIARANEPGFGKVAIDLDAGSVVVYWHGEPPRWVKDLAENPGHGVTVELVGSAFSEGQLLAAARKIFQAGPGLDVQIFQVSMTDDLSGVIVTVAEESDRPSLSQDLKRIAGVPVAVIHGEPGVEQPHFGDVG